MENRGLLPWFNYRFQPGQNPSNRFEPVGKGKIKVYCPWFKPGPIHSNRFEPVAKGKIEFYCHWFNYRFKSGQNPSNCSNPVKTIRTGSWPNLAIFTSDWYIVVNSFNRDSAIWCRLPGCVSMAQSIPLDWHLIGWNCPSINTAGRQGIRNQPVFST